MAHFAEVDENNVVLRVIVVANRDNTDPHTGQENEVLGKAFCTRLLGGNWIQTSYNGSFRKNYASDGYTYDAQRDAFIPPKEFDSWILDEDTCRWKPPFDAPTLTQDELELGGEYIWDEDAHQADNTKGWVLITGK